MSDADEVLKELARLAHAQASVATARAAVALGRSVLDELQNQILSYVFLAPQLEAAIPPICAAFPELQGLLQHDKPLGPMALTAYGGSRMAPTDFVAGLCRASAMQIFCLGGRNDVDAFHDAILSNLEQLRRAVRGEAVTVLQIAGLGGVTLTPGHIVNTPWGQVIPAPVREFRLGGHSRHTDTTCLLTVQRPVNVTLDWSAEGSRDKFNDPPDPFAQCDLLLPFALALASPDLVHPTAAVVTWRAQILPFQGPGFSFSYTLDALSSVPTPLDEDIERFERWAALVADSHLPQFDVPARRLVQATGHRNDRADALIDAVIVWESLFGADTEVTYRVSAALAKLLQADAAHRPALRKRLKEVYQLRSRIVHGSQTDRKDVEDAAQLALSTAIEAMRESYQRGKDWLRLTSTARGERLLDE
jgi:hypothetical protein